MSQTNLVKNMKEKHSAKLSTKILQEKSGNIRKLFYPIVNPTLRIIRFLRVPFQFNAFYQYYRLLSILFSRDVLFLPQSFIICIKKHFNDESR